MKKQSAERSTRILKRNFFNRPTLDVARDLLGCVIVRKIVSGLKQKEIRAVITDVEAYIGEDDLACHASKGRTTRNEVLYGEPGSVYVYLIYGMYNIVNFVTEKRDFPAAVMVRAVKVEGVDYKKTEGPGKVCRELGIDRKLHGADATIGKELWIEKGKKINPSDIRSDVRVGVAYAQHCAVYPWRFRLMRD